MSKRVEPIFITGQKIIILPKAKPIVAKHVLMVIKVRYNEPKFNQHNGSIVREVPRDLSRGIHNVNKVPKPNYLCCTYYHQIGHQINECPFIEDNVRQGFAKHL
jgi:hypothetical protein